MLQQSVIFEVITTICGRLASWLAFFSHKVFLIKICTLCFRYNAIPHLIDHSTVVKTLRFHIYKTDSQWESDVWGREPKVGAL